MPVVLYTCTYCFRPLEPHEITWDHLVPRCRGGRGHRSNRTISCDSCNRKKGPLTQKEYEAFRPRHMTDEPLYGLIADLAMYFVNLHPGVSFRVDPDQHPFEGIDISSLSLTTADRKRQKQEAIRNRAPTYTVHRLRPVLREDRTLGAEVETLIQNLGRYEFYRGVSCVDSKDNSLTP